MSIVIDTDAIAEKVAEKVLAKLGAAVNPAHDPLLPRAEACEILDVSLSTFRRLELKPDFPKAKRPGGSRPRWLRSELLAYKANL